MKKNIIALAIASAVAAPIAMADAPTVYGVAHAAIVNVEDAGSQVESIASRVGIKGSEDLGNGLKAVYKMEMNVDLSGKDSKQFNARNTYVGLAGGFGTILMGTHDTPLKMSQASDLFNDGKFDNSKTSGGVLSKGGEVRADRVIAYVSPSFSGVKIVAAAVSGTTDTNAVTTAATPAMADLVTGVVTPGTAASTSSEDSELSDGYSIAAMYGSTKKGLYLAAAYNGGDMFDNAEETRVSAQYKAGGLAVNAMWQNEDNTGSNITANAGYKMGKMMPKIKYSTSDLDNGTNPSTIAVGLNYSLGKKTTAYVEYGTFDSDKGTSTDTSTVSVVGLQHKF